MRPEDAPTRPLQVVPARMARHQRSGAQRLARHLPVVGWVVLLVVGLVMLAVGASQLGGNAGPAAQAQPAGATPPAAPEQEPPAAASASEPARQAGEAGSAAPPVAARTRPAGTPDTQGGAAAHGHGQAQDGDPERSGQEGGGLVVNGLQTLGDSCEQSFLEPHDGFQDAPRCVDTQMGEVPAAERGPQLLIVGAPDSVRADEPFIIRVSSRNLVRDRFLGAADGGYYAESSFLDEQGLVRGHFHTGCRRLPHDAAAAPDPAGELVFFAATEDARGGAEPDTVEVRVPGIAERGVVQCAVWAGDGSHRIPMTEAAQQIPAFDAVRLVVR